LKGSQTDLGKKKDPHLPSKCEKSMGGGKGGVEKVVKPGGKGGEKGPKEPWTKKGKRDLVIKNRAGEILPLDDPTENERLKHAKIIPTRKKIHEKKMLTYPPYAQRTGKEKKKLVGWERGQSTLRKKT